MKNVTYVKRLYLKAPDTWTHVSVDSAVARGTLSEFREAPAAEVSALLVTVPCVVCGHRRGSGTAGASPVTGSHAFI